MTTAEALSNYYEKSPFDEDEVYTQNYVKFYAGKRFIVVPNFPLRKRLIKYHDLSHLLTGYTNSRIGEGEVSAWELGAGIGLFHISSFFGIFGLATGVRLSPRRMVEAFIRGRNSDFLLKYSLTELLEKDFHELKQSTFDYGRGALSKIMDYPLMFFCFSLAVVIYPFLMVVSWIQSRIGVL